MLTSKLAMQFSDVFLGRHGGLGLGRLRTSTTSEVARDYDKATLSCYDFRVLILKNNVKI